ncbi:MAG: ABC transporter ATP-binding protein [bacterium]|nr:ABC transporter ATP-binding protein [bacterium]
MAIIECSNLTKVFRLAHEPRRSVKESLAAMLRPRVYEQFKAIDNVSLSVAPGEFISLIGPNGCGKSTLLKIIAGIYQPTSGELTVRDRISPFLELGVGFNYDLTARENIYVYGSILGLSRRQVNEKFDDIVRFSELERFIDTPLRNFSSGMYVRLAFATAVQSDAPILLFDEVLAVGDERFQRKCFALFEKMKYQEKTIVFVSHTMDSVMRFSDRVILMDRGKKIMEGPPEQVVTAYKANMKT